jgi:ankyrin repeat protein
MKPHSTNLFNAVAAKDAARVSELIAAGADVNAKDDFWRTPLHVAAGMGSTEIVEKLIEAGANIHARDGDGDTPLHYAAKFGTENTVVVLIDARANVNARDEGSWTPLHEAIRFGNPAMVKPLLEAGADANARDGDGRTPLHYAAWHISQVHDSGIINTLIEAGADVNVMDNGGKTPRHYATERGKDAIIKILSEVENRNAKVLEQALKEGTSMQKEDRRMYGAIVQETQTGQYGFLSTDHPLSYGSPVFVPLDDTYRPTGEPPKGPRDVGNLISCGYVGQLPLRGGKHEGWTPEFADAVLKAGYRFDPEYRLDSMDGAAKAITDPVDKDANRHAKTLEQTLKDGVRVSGNTMTLDPASYTVVRTSTRQCPRCVQDLKEAGLKPAAVVTEKEGTAIVLKHGMGTGEREAIEEKLGLINQPDLTVSQGGPVRPTMVLEATGARIDLARVMERPGSGKEKGRGMEI